MAEEVVDKLLVELGGSDAPYLNMLANAERQLTSTTDRLISIGKRMTLALSTSLSAISAVSVHAFASFDQAMTASTAIMVGITDDMRERMAKLAIDMSTTSVTAADKLAEGYFFLASAGLDAEQAMMALDTVNKFAIAGNFDMARATDLVTDAQSALGLVVKDSTQNMHNMARVSDVLIKANTLANASAEQFATSLTTKSAAALRGLNKDIEEGVAVLAAYADQGVKAQLSGERLSILLRESQRAASKQASEWSALGLNLYDLQGNMIPIVDLIRQLEKATGGMSDEQKFATFTMLGFRSESMDAIKPLLGMSDRIADYERKLRSAGGVTEQVANDQMKSFSSQMKIFKNQVAAAAIEIGEILAPSILALNEVLAAGIQYWRDTSRETKIVVVTLGKIVAVTGPTLVSLGLLNRYLPALATGFSSLTSSLITAFTWFRNVALVAAAPYLGVIALIAAVGAAVLGLAYLIVGPEGLSNAWETAKAAVMGFVDKAIGFLAHFSTNMGLLFTWLKDNWKNLLLDMFNAWVTMQQNNLHNAMVMIQTLARLWVAFTGWLTTYLPQFFEYIFSEEFLTKVYDGLRSALDAFINWTKEMWPIFDGFMRGLGALYLAGLKAMIGATGDFAIITARIFSQVLRGEIPNPAVLAAEFLHAAEKRLSDAGTAVGKVVGESLVNAGLKAADALDKIQDQVVRDFNAGADNINFFDTAATIIGEGTDKLRGPLDGFKSTVAGLPDFVFEHAKDTKDELEKVMTPDVGLEKGLTGPLAATERQANATAKAVKAIQSGLEGAARGSIDAALKVDSYFATLAKRTGTPVMASATLNQSIKAQAVGAERIAGVPGAASGTSLADTQRTTMIGLLTDIRDHVRRGSVTLANFEG